MSSSLWRRRNVVIVFALLVVGLLMVNTADAKTSGKGRGRPAPAPTTTATPTTATPTTATPTTSTSSPTGTESGSSTGATTSASTTGSATTSSGTTSPAGTTTTAAPPAGATGIDWGMHVLGDMSGGWSEIGQVESQVGRRVTIVHGFTAWDAGPFDAAGAAQVAAHGATPLLTWEPWAAPYDTNDARYSLSSIARGDHDAYIRQFASQIAAYGGPVLLRFAHEMNGNWYPWSEQVNGNQPGQYVAAWRHVHDVVVGAGAKNAVWVWSPNIDDGGGWSTPMQELYPGDAYVDRVALDGYNWGSTQGGWQSFAAIFDPSMKQLASIAPSKPVIVAETASTESGGDKAQWISDMFAYISRTPQIRALVWFNENKESDWRIQSSSGSVSAFRQGASSGELSGALAN